MHIQFATSDEFPDLTNDDRLAAGALAGGGSRVEPVVWTEPRHGTAVPDAVVIRSCWDYHLRPAEFRAWLTALERAGTAIINPLPLMLWNLHKSYLPELSYAGVPTVPTVPCSSAERRTLARVMDDAGWDEAVIKPAVSLNAYETWRVRRMDAPAHEERFTRLRRAGDVLVQRFIPEVTTDGEWSLVFFGTQFSHAVRKCAKEGDFRVQIEHGGSAVAATPPDLMINDAERVLAALPAAPVYCRVDGVLTPDAFVVMEVECIDPVLFFELHPPAATLFADAVLTHLGSTG